MSETDHPWAPADRPLARRGMVRFIAAALVAGSDVEPALLRTFDVRRSRHERHAAPVSRDTMQAFLDGLPEDASPRLP